MFPRDHLRTVPAYDARLAACGLRTVEQIVTHLGERVAAWSRTTDTVFVRAPDGLPGFYVKRYFYPHWHNRLRGMFRGTLAGMHRGQAEFRALHTMCRLGVPAVRPVAYGARRTAGFATACFLITEEVPEARNLTSFARDVTSGAVRLSAGQRGEFCRTLAEQAARMHAAGFLHGKLFWRNILVRRHADGEPEFFFLDARPPRNVRRLALLGDARREELARLAASAMPFTSRTDRQRFVRHYERCIGGAHERALWQEVERRAHRYDRHEAQRIRMNDLFDNWNRALERGSASDRGSASERVGAMQTPWSAVAAEPA